MEKIGYEVCRIKKNGKNRSGSMQDKGWEKIGQEVCKIKKKWKKQVRKYVG